MRDKNLSFFLCIFLLFVVVVLFLHFSKDQYYTEVIYETGSSEQNGTASTAKTKQTSKNSKTSQSSQKNRTSKQSEPSKKNQTSKESQASKKNSVSREESQLLSDEPEVSEECILYGDVPIIDGGETSEETSQIEHSRIEYSQMEDESTEQSDLSEEETSASSTAESEIESKLVDVFASDKEYVQRLSQKYDIELWVCLEENLTSDQWDCYTDPEDLYASLEKLDGMLEKLDTSLLSKISQRGYPLKVTLVKKNFATEHLADQTGISSGRGIILQDGENSVIMNQEFSKAVAVFYYFVLESTGNLTAFSQEFVQYNPLDFRYGKYKPQYVAKDPSDTYFLEVDGLKSLREDVASLYSAYYCNQLPERYRSADCPLSQKLTAMLEGFTKYL